MSKNPKTELMMVRSNSRRHKLTVEEDGSALIEFTISATLLFMLIFGIMDCARAIYSYHFVSNAAREATRYAMVRGGSWNGASCTTTSTFACTANNTNVTNYVKSITPQGFSAANLTVNATWPGTNAKGTSCSASGATTAQGCIVSVQVSYSFNFILPFLPKNTLVLTSTSKVAISQ